MMQPLLYIHGGPGLHGEAERRWLLPAAAAHGWALQIWDERLSGARTWEACVQSVLEAAREAARSAPVTVLAHSFGACLASEAARRHPELFSQMVFLAPTLDMRAVFLNLIELVARDQAVTRQVDVAEGLRERASASRAFYDASMQEGLALAFQQPTALPHYWGDPAAMGRWLQIVSEPAWTIDFATQASILSGFSGTLAEERLPIRALTFFADRDQLVTESDQRPVLESRFASYETKTFEGAGHFGHLERPEDFFELFSRELRGGGQGLRRGGWQDRNQLQEGGI